MILEKSLARFRLRGSRIIGWRSNRNSPFFFTFFALLLDLLTEPFRVPVYNGHLFSISFDTTFNRFCYSIDRSSKIHDINSTIARLDLFRIMQEITFISLKVQKKKWIFYRSDERVWMRCCRIVNNDRNILTLASRSLFAVFADDRVVENRNILYGNTISKWNASIFLHRLFCWGTLYGFGIPSVVVYFAVQRTPSLFL